MLRRIRVAIWCILFPLAVLSAAAALAGTAMWLRAQFAYERVGASFATTWPNHEYYKFGIILDFGTNEIWMLDRIWVEPDPKHSAELWQQSPHPWYASRVIAGQPRPITGVGVFPKRGSWFNCLGFECATDTTPSHYDYPGWEMSHTPRVEIWEAEERQLGLRAPYWAWLLMLLILPVVYAGKVSRVKRRSRRKRQGLCERCGYDLRATPGQCPECGTISAASQTTYRALAPPAPL